MARLDIEEMFWIEIISIAAKMGSEDQAIGNAIRFFRFAQQKHKAGRLVSEEEFKIEGFSEHLFPKFAERVAGGIQARGAQKHFKWLDQKVSAGQSGGQKSAQRPRDAQGRLLPKSKLDPSETQAGPDDHQPSYSISNTSKIFLAKKIKADIKIKPSTKIAQASAFAEFYLGYPRKVKKSETRKIFAREIKSAELSQILFARDRYLKDCEVNGITGKFIQHPSTFLNSWRDWLDPSTGTPSPEPSHNWSEMATRAWHMLQGEVEADKGLSELIDKIGIEHLTQFHRDDFRQGGRVALLLKETSEAS